MKLITAMLAMGAMMTATLGAHAEKETWKQKCEKVTDAYLDQVYFHYSPTAGTLAGYHQYDAQLENLSKQNIDAQIADLKTSLKKMKTVRENMNKKKHTHYADGQQAGEPGSMGVRFKASIAPDGSIRIIGIERQDPALTEEQVARLKKSVFSFKYHPFIQSGIAVEHETPVNVLLEKYDPVLADLDIVESNIQSTLLTLETIRPWEKNADNYSGTAANAAFTLMERKFASPDERFALTDRTREANADSLCRCAHQLEEPAAHFYRDRHRAIAGDRQLLREGCSAGLCRRQRSRAQGGFR